MKAVRAKWLVPLGMMVGGGGLFAAVAADVVYHGRLQQMDGVIAPYLHEHSNWYLVFVAAGFSGLGEFWLLLPFAVAVGLWLVWKRQWRCVWVWAVGLSSSPALCGILKAYFAIPRPSRFTLYTFAEKSGYSFPSGHTMGVMITCGMLALIWMRLAPRARGKRVLVGMLAGMIGLLTAAALVYIGVHYFTDVLGGWTLSVAWLGVMRGILPPAEMPGGPATGAVAPTAAADSKVVSS